MMNIVCRQVITPYRANSLCLLGSRYLYTPAALGVDGYLLTRERIKAQFNEMEDKFRGKMREFVSAQSTNMVFTEDLKHMVHIADDTEDDLDLIQEMMLKFNQQNKDLRFGNFIFGPVVMRMYHHLNRPKEAFKAFTHPELEQFFEQVVSYQILMDLLLRNEMYDEVMQVMDIIVNKQLAGARYPRTAVVLTMAAAYKKNTPDSLEYMKKLWAMLQESGHEPMRRAITFAAALAINQNAPHIALELLSQLPKQSYVTVRNLRALALAEVNRPEDALPILRSVLEVEGPQENKHTFCSEVLEKVGAAVSRSDSKEVQHEFKRIMDQLTQLEHVVDTTLDSQLCLEMDKVQFTQAPQRRDQRLVAKFDSSRDRLGGGGPSYPRARRPSLVDME